MGEERAGAKKQSGQGRECEPSTGRGKATAQESSFGGEVGGSGEVVLGTQAQGQSKFEEGAWPP